MNVFHGADELFLDTFGCYSDHEMEYEIFSSMCEVFEPQTEAEVLSLLEKISDSMSSD